MSASAADRICRKLAQNGAGSAHIGGGEPFLGYDSLKALLRAMARHDIGVDYIETNAFWAGGDDFIDRRLDELRALGGPPIMVSVDPFHAEFVPLCRPLNLIRRLRLRGYDHFIWQERFLRRLSQLDNSRALSHDELKAALGADYVENTAREYGVKANGRALDIARRLTPPETAERIAQKSGPCGHLLDGAHCHVDLYENVVPPGCPGISIALDDYIAGDVPEDKYPAAARLLSGGVAALYAYAMGAGFAPDSAGYATKCDLCFAMRAHLAKNAPSPDLSPPAFYN